MALQSNNNLLAGDAYGSIRANAANWKAQAQNALSALQAGSVTTDFIFRLLDQLNGCVTSLTTWQAVSGLATYATNQGYTGTITTDTAATISAANSCISWVTTNFPTNGGTPAYLLGHVLNADGTRTPRSFTSTQTAGLQTALTNFIATIS